MSVQQQMIEQANAVMENAYAPYSEFQVGACFQAEDGSLYSGCNVENASYAATLCAEACALSALISAGKKQIQAVALTSSGRMPVTPCGICLQRIAEFATHDTPIYVQDPLGGVLSYTLRELFPTVFNKEYLEA